MNNRILALLAAFSATTIYGLNHTIAKVIMPHYIGAFGFIMLRVVGAASLFWLLSLFTPKEKIDRKDYPRIFFGALLGMCINMLMFFKGLQLSTPDKQRCNRNTYSYYHSYFICFFSKRKVDQLEVSWNHIRIFRSITAHFIWKYDSSY